MGLSQEHINVVKATAPVVAQHATEITRNFYKRMLSGNPEVLQFFNVSNQHTGRQPQALADAVVGYASNIDNLGVLGDAVSRMVHKHVALLVKAEHYPIVAKHLMDAIHEILGAAVTPDVHNAWAAAVQQLAELLIDAESKQYAALASTPGGWSGHRAFRITSRRQVGSLVHLAMSPTDGLEVLKPLPGHYLTLQFTPTDLGLSGPHVAPRHYSVLCSNPATGYEICVRRLERGVYSAHIFDKLEVGTEILVNPPTGAFTLASSTANLVFISAGVGFTPLRSMFEQATAFKYWFHVCHSREEADFTSSLISPNKMWVTTEQTKRPTVADVLTLLPDSIQDKHFYLCGPNSFLREFIHGLASHGVAASCIHYENFGPHVQN